MSTLKVGTIQDHANSNTAISIDSSGRPTFPATPAWRVHNVGAQARTNWSTGSPYEPIVYSAVTLDNASGWTSGASNYYTIPVAGNYMFFINQRCDGPNGGAWFQLYLMVDSGSGYEFRHRWIQGAHSSLGFFTFSVSDMGIFAAGDKLQVRFGTASDTSVTLQGASNANATSQNQYTSFAGYRVG